VTKHAALIALADRIETEEPSSNLARDMARALGYTETPDGWRLGNAPPLRVLPPWLDSLDASASLMPPGWTVCRMTADVGQLVIVGLCRGQLPLILLEGRAKTEPRARASAAFRARAAVLNAPPPMKVTGT
jgi:hypothetical protein